MLVLPQIVGRLVHHLQEIGPSVHQEHMEIQFLIIQQAQVILQ
mgnify:CR=1 FL=1